MNKKSSVVKITLLIASGVIATIVVFRSCKPNLSGNLKYKLVNPGVSDTVMNNSRHIGNISLDKFIALACKTGYSDFDTTCIIRDKDSIFFKVKTPKMFFGADAGDWWKEKYNNLPIHIFKDNSFKAKRNVINNKEYIYIPYHILFNLVDFIGKIDASKPTQNATKMDENEQDITIKSENDIKNLEETGSKIQTEGIVFKNVSDIIILNRDNSGSKYKQIEILWRYARQHWTYINDPVGTTDTWRPASETIENYYFTTEKQYTGDCDDFAILMASFSRQIGLRSRFVCAVGQNGGHAYAEFFVPPNERSELKSILGNVYDNSSWVNMDWFSNQLGGKPYNGKVVRVFENL